MRKPTLQCGECGAALDSASEGGLCASCAFGLALEVSSGPESDGPAAPADTPRIPGYEVRELLGRGGMGTVWRAEQREPVRRDVAVKVVRAGFDSAEVAARFDAERQALAMMDHPNVARFFDAGTTPDGQPYFVMEHVAGQPITEYCDRRSLSVDERVSLFADVCDTVHHAHQKGIIHRDLKPSNILVLDRDGRPEAKVIDFGIAKATRPRIFDRTNLTRADQLLGTPEYMSPEQMAQGESDVDVRADVYSLGAVLYELLTGARPFDGEELRDAGLAEVLRTVREVEAPTPSEKVTTLGDERRDAARARATEPGSLVSKLRGDLDWITMRALEKERERRYASAADLAADQRRYLRHEPVTAGPPGAAYRVRKFVRRHPVGVASGAVLLVSLVAFAASMVVQAKRVAVERDRANEQAAISRQVTDFLVELFRVNDPSEARGNEVTAREILDRGAARVREEIEDPAVRGELLREMGIVYGNLGLRSESESLLREAAEAQTIAFGRTDPRTLATLDELAGAFARRGLYAEAESLQTEVVEGWRSRTSEEDPKYLNALHNLAVKIRDRGRKKESREILERIVATWRRLGQEDELGAMAAMSNLAVQYRNERRPEEAEALYEEVIERRTRVLGPDHPRTLLSRSSLGHLYVMENRADEAEEVFRETAEIQRRVLGEDHSSYWATRNGLAGVHWVREEYAQAEEIYREIHALRRDHLGAEHPHTLVTAHNLAAILCMQERFEEADSIAVALQEVRVRTFGPDHPHTLGTDDLRAMIASRRGDLESALAILSDIVARGFDDLTRMESESFRPLRGDPRFEALLEEVRRRQER